MRFSGTWVNGWTRWPWRSIPGKMILWSHLEGWASWNSLKPLHKDTSTLWFLLPTRAILLHQQDVCVLVCVCAHTWFWLQNTVLLCQIIKITSCPAALTLTGMWTAIPRRGRGGQRERNGSHLINQWQMGLLNVLALLWSQASNYRQQKKLDILAIINKTLKMQSLP